MSSFLNIDDYKPLIQDHILEQVLEDDNTILDEVEEMAVSEMRSYLNGRFNCDEIFSATGSDRNPAILLYCMDMALYHLHSRVTPRNVSELRMDRYDAAIMWLDKVVSGELAPDLPLRKDEDDNPENRLRWGSNPKPTFRF